ncbi:hypothetical protein I317_01070 [Kwoniella heveanensis CBS 569]|nr:hypothetical protein I317_01070 [Kwoniella heveanensis CBS 569]
MQKTKGDTFDLRAEEDAARRLNVGKSFTVSSSMTGLKSRAKRTDMMSKSALRERAEAVAKDHGMTIDRESQLYLMAAIETRLRSLLASSLSAQTHRVNANHLRAPPVDKRSGKGIWSHEIVSDTSGVLDSLNRLNREEEQEFRKSRMTRLAREAEMQRIRERERERAESMGIATPAASNSDLEVGPGADTSSNGFGPAAGSGAGPSTPMPMSKTSSSHSPYPANSFSTPQAPMFGAIKESKNNTPGSSMTKKAMKKMNNPRDVSAEVQHKMANATAMRSVGMGKKYGWMTGSAPAISSPLASAGSKKRKAGAEGKVGSGTGGGALFGGSKLKESTLFAGANGSEKEKEREKDKTEPSTPQTPGAASAGTPEGDRPSKKMRHAISAPTRRLISVERPPPKKGASAAELEEYTKDKDKEIRIEDDKVITMVDLTFALEHGGLGGGGRGSGKGREDDVLQRIWGRPGGPWGKDGWDGRR